MLNFINHNEKCFALYKFNTFFTENDKKCDILLEIKEKGV